MVSDLVEHLALVQVVEGEVLGGGPDCKDRSRRVDVNTDSWLAAWSPGHAGLPADVPDQLHQLSFASLSLFAGEDWRAWNKPSIIGIWIFFSNSTLKRALNKYCTFRL